MWTLSLEFTLMFTVRPSYSEPVEKNMLVILRNRYYRISKPRAVWVRATDRLIDRCALIAVRDAAANERRHSAHTAHSMRRRQQETRYAIRFYVAQRAVCATAGSGLSLCTFPFRVHAIWTTTCLVLPWPVSCLKIGDHRRWHQSSLALTVCIPQQSSSTSPA